MSNSSDGSIISAIFWMTFISVLMFWLPLLGPFIAGYVGGKKAGNAGKGFLAAILPAILSGIGIFILFSALSLPAFLSSIIGGSVAILIIVHNFPLICGAIIGGTLA